MGFWAGIIRRFGLGHEASMTDSVLLGEKDKTLRDQARSANNFLDGINPSYPIEFLDLIPKLILTTPDLRQAASRSVHLANTGLTFRLVGASKRTQEAADIEIRSLLDAHPGIINRLLFQTVSLGAVSAEAVPAMDLSGVEEIRIVPVRRIRFRKAIVQNRERYVPLELRQDGLLHTLNTEQYLYEALETEEDSPYAIPPFFAALHNVFIQKDGTSNIRKILAKVGLLGFLAMLRDKPRVMPGEDPASYAARLRDELKKFREQSAERIRSGVLYGYNDIKVQHSTVAGDARGFDTVWQANEEQIASGIDFDPALLGRSYSTTETYATVVFTALMAKLRNTRYPTERALKRFVSLHLRLRGYRFDRISADWGEDASMDPQGDATAEREREAAREIRERSIMARVDAGIIGIDQAAKEMGYEKAYRQKGQSALSSVMQASSCSCGHHSYGRLARLQEGDEGDDILTKIQEEFLSLFFEKQASAIEAFVRKAKTLIDAEDAIDRIVEEYEKEMGAKFPDAVYDDLKQAMTDGWKAGHFPVSTDWNKRPVPTTAIDWFAKANHHDIGKTFVGYGDEIRAAAVESLKTGDRAGVLRSLEKSIPGVLNDPRKRDQLADVFRNLQNRAFTFGRVKSMEAAGIERIEIVAVMDRRTSPICRVMDGKSFELSVGSQFIDTWISTEYDDGFWGKFHQPNWEPTADEVRAAGNRSDAIEKKIAPYRKMSGDEIVKLLGIPLPPYHYRCRSTAIMMAA